MLRIYIPLVIEKPGGLRAEMGDEPQRRGHDSSKALDYFCFFLNNR